MTYTDDVTDPAAPDCQAVAWLPAPLAPLVTAS